MQKSPASERKVFNRIFSTFIPISCTIVSFTCFTTIFFPNVTTSLPDLLSPCKFIDT
uniref:Uncharacterized protein n=1 Tax=Brassica oleracea TaxID=3712 RepID=A0A3P6FPW0_BRAOL|nr:unnamed protein product [Brassica oleracea]